MSNDDCINAPIAMSQGTKAGFPAWQHVGVEDVSPVAIDTCLIYRKAPSSLQKDAFSQQKWSNGVSASLSYAPTTYSGWSSDFEGCGESPVNLRTLWTLWAARRQYSHEFSAFSECIDLAGPTTEPVATAEAEGKFKSWIERWVMSAAPRQPSKPVQKSRGRGRGYYSDDADDYSDEEEFSRRLCCSNVILIRGPTGAGKSAFVHSVAADMKLTVIEINAGQERSGSIVRKLTAEATHSHSVLPTVVGDDGAGGDLNLVFFDEVHVLHCALPRVMHTLCSRSFRFVG